MEILAKRMKELRKERKITQSDLAQALEIALVSYKRYESNEREPMAPFLKSFADYFDVSVDYLLGRSDDR